MVKEKPTVGRSQEVILCERGGRPLLKVAAPTFPRAAADHWEIYVTLFIEQSAATLLG